MSSASVVQTSSGARTSDRWLHGPVIDIALGCGGLYAWIILLYAINAPTLHSLQPATFIPFVMLAISMPHYGGTLLRVYEQRTERHRYFWFSVVASALVFAVFLAGLKSALVGSLFLTLYLTWSPWHYTGQNYGLAVMFLKRRGIAFDATTKRLLYTSFILSFAITFLLWHTGANQAAPRGESSGLIHFIPIGISESVVAFAMPTVAFAYATTLIVVTMRLLRTASLIDLLPVGVLCATQALWFSIPFLVAHFGTTTGIEPFDDYFQLRIFTILTIMGHATQYLWVTSYYAKSSASPPWRGHVQYYGKAAATGIAIWTLPAILFSADGLGTYSYNGGLSLLIASAVNVHHFILDGAIWKLRNMKIASVLIRAVPDEESLRLDSMAQTKPAQRRLVWGVTIAVALSAYFVFWQQSFVQRRLFDSGAYEKVETGLDRLALLGRDSASARIRLGHAYANQGAIVDAERQLRRSVELEESIDGFNALMEFHWKQADYSAVVEDSEAAIARFPSMANILITQSAAWTMLDRPNEARDALERAHLIAPESLEIEREILQLKQRETQAADSIFGDAET